MGEFSVIEINDERRRFSVRQSQRGGRVPPQLLALSGFLEWMRLEDYSHPSPSEKWLGEVRMLRVFPSAVITLLGSAFLLECLSFIHRFTSCSHEKVVISYDAHRQLRAVGLCLCDDG